MARPRLMVRPRVVLGAVVLVGLLAAAASLSVPVSASFADDPILRLRAFGRAQDSPVERVDCGSALEGLKADEAPPTIYGLARDRACQRESWRRALAATAAASVVLVLTFLALSRLR